MAEYNIGIESSPEKNNQSPEKTRRSPEKTRRSPEKSPRRNDLPAAKTHSSSSKMKSPSKKRRSFSLEEEQGWGLGSIEDELAHFDSGKQHVKQESVTSRQQDKSDNSANMSDRMRSILEEALNVPSYRSSYKEARKTPGKKGKGAAPAAVQITKRKLSVAGTKNVERKFQASVGISKRAKQLKPTPLSIVPVQDFQGSNATLAKYLIPKMHVGKMRSLYRVK